jgi:hypothetical protein
MPAKRINPNLIKVHYSYTATELAKRLGVHKNTIRNWRREGLPALACRRVLFMAPPSAYSWLVGTPADGGTDAPRSRLDACDYALGAARPGARGAHRRAGGGPRFVSP